MLNIERKVVVLTGASSGIGKATAKVLAKNGAKVVLAARRKERLQALKENINKQGGTAEFKVTDVTSQKEVEELARFALDTFGKMMC